MLQTFAKNAHMYNTNIECNNVKFSIWKDTNIYQYNNYLWLMLVVKVIIIASPEKKYIVPTTIFRKLISEHSFFYWWKVILSRPLQQRQYFHVDACLKVKKSLNRVNMFLNNFSKVFKNHSYFHLHTFALNTSMSFHNNKKI